MTARRIDALVRDIEALVAGYEAGRPLAEGITLAIAGKTNVGKSTLFNALLGQDRAIVTPYPGTTRDFLRERLIIGDSVFHLVDMAGIGRPSHPVERKGCAGAKGRPATPTASCSSSTRPDPWAKRTSACSRGSGQVYLLYYYQQDRHKPRAPGKWSLPEKAAGIPVVRLSALKGTNIDGLKRLLHDTFTPSKRKQEDVVLHLRQKLLLEEILAGLERSRALHREGHPDEIVLEELRGILPSVGRLSGEIKADDVIEDIFGRFCVGK